MSVEAIAGFIRFYSGPFMLVMLFVGWWIWNGVEVVTIEREELEEEL